MPSHCHATFALLQSIWSLRNNQSNQLLAFSQLDLNLHASRLTDSWVILMNPIGHSHRIKERIYQWLFWIHEQRHRNHYQTTLPASILHIKLLIYPLQQVHFWDLNQQGKSYLQETLLIPQRYLSITKKNSWSKYFRGFTIQLHLFYQWNHEVVEE